MMFATMSVEELNCYCIDKPIKEYRYLKKDSQPNPEIDYNLMKENWDQTLRKFNFKAQEIDSIYQIVS